MRVSKSNWQLGTGALLYAATLITAHFVEIPNALYHGFILVAITLELWGIIKIARSPAMKNSRLRRWKLRLVGRTPK